MVQCEVTNGSPEIVGLLFNLIVAWQAAAGAVFACMLIVVVCVKSKASSGSFA